MMKLIERFFALKIVQAMGVLFTFTGTIYGFWIQNFILGGIVLIVLIITLLLIAATYRNEITSSAESNAIGNSKVSLLCDTIPWITNPIGREKDIQNIQNCMRENRIVSIHAHGGVGKTAVAAEIATRIKDGVGTYQYLGWITSTGDLEKDLIKLKIPGVSKKDQNYNTVSKFLQSYPTFLIIDNMDVPPTTEENDKLNTIAGRTKILITTRASIAIGKQYKLRRLNLESAIRVFYKYYTDKEEPDFELIKARNDYSCAKNIVKAASYNTLFIELIGKMACADGWALDMLWEELKDNVFAQNSRYRIITSHGKEGRLLDQMRELYRLSNLTERQKEIMAFISLFPAEHSIFYDVFEWAGLRDDDVDNFGELWKRGWIEKDEEGYFVHTVVKGSIEQQCKTTFDEVKFERLINELANTDQYIPRDMSYTKVLNRIIVPETICGLLADKESDELFVSKLFNNIALVYYDLGKYNEALKYFEKALSIDKKVLGPEHRDTAGTYNNIAMVQSELGKYNEALEYYNQALPILENEKATDHTNLASTYNNIASVYYDLPNYDEALKYFNKALDIFKNEHGEEYSNTASAYSNIADVYREKGDYNEALKYYNLALPIHKRVNGKEHPNTAYTYEGIGKLFYYKEDYIKAKECLEQAVAIYENKLGKDHPFTKDTKETLEHVIEKLNQ